MKTFLDQRGTSNWFSGRDICQDRTISAACLAVCILVVARRAQSHLWTLAAPLLLCDSGLYVTVSRVRCLRALSVYQVVTKRTNATSGSTTFVIAGSSINNSLAYFSALYVLICKRVRDRDGARWGGGGYLWHVSTCYVLVLLPGAFVQQSQDVHQHIMTRLYPRPSPPLTPIPSSGCVLSYYQCCQGSSGVLDRITICQFGRLTIWRVWASLSSYCHAPGCHNRNSGSRHKPYLNTVPEM